MPTTAWLEVRLALVGALRLAKGDRSALSCFDRSLRFFDFMVPYNWSQVPQSALFVLVGLESESGVLAAPAAQAIEVAAAIAVLVYEWFIARVALDATASAAAFVVFVDLVLGALISHVASSLY